MDWSQTLTIIGSIAAGGAWLHHLSKKDSERHDAEFSETRKLWASLLEKTYKVELEIKQEINALRQEIKEIKLFNSSKSSPKK